jgi:ATP-dependent helicase/nuclease subunit A
VRDARDGETPRPARYGDMMILLRRRTGLGVYEAALRAHGIPYFGASRGRLLETLEAADLQALLRIFLPHRPMRWRWRTCLRCPLFAFGDELLLALTRDGCGPAVASVLRAHARRDDAACARAATLLSGWLDASVQLPVHDLLDRVFDEGDLMQRYAAAVDEMAWPGVRANLEAFIELALKVDSGRFPSLPRFLDELTRLRGDDDAPDEGLILGEDPARGRVRVLTVHAAKGLEAPIVWLADAISRPRVDSGARVLLSWPPGARAPDHLSLLQRKENEGQARAGIIDAEARAAAREDANLLYVAVTRARQFLFASGVSPARGTAADSWLERLADATRHCNGVGRPDAAGVCHVHGEADASVVARPADLPGTARAARLPVPAIGQRRSVETMLDAQIWGIGLHAWLEALACGEPPPARPSGLDATRWRELESIARRLVSSALLRRFFDPALHLWAASELEFVLPDGRLGRIDRLVEFADDIWILDYKSGLNDEFAAAYAEQLATYVDAVRHVRPGKILRAALITPDGRLDIRL